MDAIISYTQLALWNLWHHKVRGVLAMIGILVGTASVVALLTGGEMATNHALDQFKTLGTHLLSLSLTNERFNADPGQSREFLLSDIPELKSASPTIQIVAPYITTYTQSSYNTQLLNASVIGVTDALSQVLPLTLKKGRHLSDLDSGRNFCMIGSELAKNLKKSGVINPIGVQIQVGNFYETIIGVLNPVKPNYFFYANLNTSLLIPLENAYNINKQAAISNIIMRTTINTDLKSLETNITNKIAIMMPHKKTYFISASQILSIITEQSQTFRWLLGMIGGISLFVGGIGVMNVMLMSVIERRQEIGLRMAVGATKNNILCMFLLESIIQTVLGGLLGVIFGMVISYFIAFFAGWSFAIYLTPPLIGFAVSVMVGLLAGLYPALRASNLDPIVTLRTA